MDSSRFFLKDDPVINDFNFKDFSFKVNIDRWWSRPYEYCWLFNVAKSLINKENAIDIATGKNHPTMFILRDCGFNRVVGTDILDIDKIELRKYFGDNIKYIKDDIVNTKIQEKFDLVSCISFLEHLEENKQIIALNNIINLIKNNGYLFMTLDYPGWTYKINIDEYIKLLGGFKINVEETDIKLRLNSKFCYNAGRVAKKKLSCYRILAQKL